MCTFNHSLILTKKNTTKLDSFCINTTVDIMKENQMATTAGQELGHYLVGQKSLRKHPQWSPLIEIATGETNLSSAGFPYICDRSFRLFVEEVPHLFREGQLLLSWLRLLEKILTDFDELSEAQRKSVERAIKVIRTVVLTAGITAPPDLWLLKQVLSSYKEAGICDWFLEHKVLEPEAFSKRHKIDIRQLKIDLHFLHSRGYLEKGDGDFLISDKDAVIDVLRNIQAINPNFRVDIFSKLRSWLSGQVKSKESEKFLRTWLTFEADDSPTGSWIANHHQVELGYRLLPLVLALRALELTEKLSEGIVFAENVPNMLPEIAEIFSKAGYLQEGRVTQIGGRVFQRGSGPFGIIYAYHPYINQLNDILKSKVVSTWVHRGDNVCASQDANSKTFQAANNALDAFCQEHKFKFTVFVEHAVGQGEATRQRFLKDGENEIRYFGADLEDAAINRAIEQQEIGRLPANMKFIRSADIGQPSKVLKFLKKEGLADEPTVMVVGNGFHEIREQTNDKMIDVFRQYQEAGFVLIFAEESALHDEALLRTAWNTYHAGFRYVHEISGQGLRPAWELEQGQGRWSWRKCATVGGYTVLEKYSYRSRTIYPHKRPIRKNPSISETYFCIPQSLAKFLRIS